MSLKTKSLCSFKRSALADNFVQVQKIVSSPKFICPKCARVANESNFLCKAKKLRG